MSDSLAVVPRSPPEPPGPPRRALFSLLRRLRRDRVQFFWDLRETYGEVVAIRFPGRRMLVLTNPEHVRHVLQKNGRNYVKAGPLNQERRAVVGDGVLTLDGRPWLTRRRKVQPAFGAAQLANLVDVMAKTTERSLRRWEALARAGEPFDIAAELTSLTIDQAGETLFGVPLTGEAAEIRTCFDIMVEEGSRRMASLVKMPLAIPTRRNRRYRRVLKILDRVVYQIIEERRASASRGGDLLSLLLELEGSSLDDRALRNEVITFLFAGSESTAASLGWAVWLIGTHPEVEAKLRAEVAQVLGDRDPTADDLAKLDYTRMVIQETLRLYPPAWIIDRVALEDDEIGGYPVRAGTEILILPWIQHRHADYWEEPAAFRPERFADEASPSRQNFSYCPFGGGPRVCIGSRFAILESQVILAMLVQRYRVQVDRDHPIELLPHIALRPKHGIRVTLSAAIAQAPDRAVS